MNFKEYADKAWQYAVYPDAGKDLVYPSLGLFSEIGELAAKAKRIIRDGKIPERSELLYEMGDVLWYLAALATTESILRSTEITSPAEREMDQWHLSLGSIQDVILELSKRASKAVLGYSESSKKSKVGRIHSAIRVLFVLAGMLDSSFDEIAQLNLDKLADRQARGVIQGSGDKR